MAVGGIAGAGALETLGGSLLVGGAVLAADAIFGGAIGNAAEGLYTTMRDTPTQEPEEMPISR